MKLFVICSTEHNIMLQIYKGQYYTDEVDATRDFDEFAKSYERLYEIDIPTKVAIFSKKDMKET